MVANNLWPNVAVIGSGSWATAIVKILLNNVERVGWWIREPEIASHIAAFGRNPVYLSQVEFEAGRLHISSDINEVLSQNEVVVFCIPAAFLHDALAGMDPSLLQGKLVVSAIKGIIPAFNSIIADYFDQHKGVGKDRFVVVTGPSHAEEVAQEKLTFLTVASMNQDHAQAVSGLFSCRYISTILSDDIYGTEYAPVLKNIYAIASGICRGLGYGDNFQAVLVSNAVQEIKRFLEVVHPIDRDINSSVYLGDLLVTCYSQFSRNRTFGNMIGKGYSVQSAQLEMNMVAEGYYATKCIREMNEQFRVHMPIMEAVYHILYEKKSPASEISMLTSKLV